MSAAVKIDFQEPFTQYPNTLFIQTTKFRLPGEQTLVLNYIIRNTFGWHTPTCTRDIGRIALQTGMNKQNVCRAISKLSEKNIIVAEGNQLSVSLNYSQWGVIRTDNAVSEPVIKTDNESLSNLITNGDDTIIVNKDLKETRSGSFYECVCECDADIISYKDFKKFRRRKNETADDFDTLFNSAGEQDKAEFLASVGNNLSLVMQFRKKGFTSLAIQMKFIEFMAGKTSADTPQKDTEEEKQSLPLPSPLPEKAHASGPDTEKKDDVKHCDTEKKQDVKSSDAGTATVDRINDLCKQISDMNRDGKKRFNPWQFAQGSLNAKCHPGAVEEVLDSVIRQWPIIRTPWAYVNRILAVQSGNYHARDFQRDSGRVKQEFNRHIAENPELVPGFSMKSF